MAKIGGVKGNYNARFWYYDVFGKRKSKYKSGFKTKHDADSWASNERDKLQGIDTEKTTAMDELVDIVLKEKELQGIAYNTMRKYKLYANMVKNYFGKMSILDIKKNHIVEFLEKHKVNKNGMPVSENVAQLKKSLSLVYQYALSEEITTYNPLPYIKLQEKEIFYTIYTEQQAKDLIVTLKEAKSSLYTVCLLALFFGMRRGEICALKKSDIENNIIDIKHSAYRNRDTKELLIKSVKTASGKRRLPFPETLKEELLWYQNYHNINTDYVACSKKGNMLDPDGVTARFAKFLKDNNLPKIKLHELRHTFARISLDNNTDLDTLKRSLGHSSIDITSNIYLHNDSKLISNQIKNITQILLK
jgi:integrase